MEKSYKKLLENMVLKAVQGINKREGFGYSSDVENKVTKLLLE